MRRLGLSAVVGCLLLAAAPAAAAAPPLQPTGKWVVDFGESHCVAYREYGTVADPVTFTIKAPVFGDSLQVGILTKKNGASDSAEQLCGTWQVGAGPPLQATALTYQGKGAERHTLLLNLPREQLAPAISAGSASMTMAFDGARSYSFSLPALRGVMKVVDECRTGLRDYWNVEDGMVARMQERLSSAYKRSRKDKEETPPPADDGKRAKAQLARVFSSNDYPGQSLFDGEDGTVAVVLLIDEQGKVADCTLVKTSGLAALDAQTCIIIRSRAKYEPATDAKGKPRRDADTAVIRWLIP